MVVPVPPEERVIVLELREVTTLDVDIEEAMFTVAAKPERLVSVSVAVPEDPTKIVNVAGFVTIAKSGTGSGGLTVKETVRE